MKYRAILFDIDGTLINSLPPYLKVMSTVLKRYHHSVPSEKLKHTFSMPLTRAFRSLRIPINERNQFEIDYLNVKNSSHLRPSLFPGITALFHGLERNLLPGLGIVTSGGNAEVKALDVNFKFMKQIWVAVTADTLPYHKPAPEPLLYAIDQMGMSANQALYIGDAKVDMEAARNAKMDFGIAGWGADPKVHFNQYQYNFKRPEDVLKLL